ncbi:D-sedoheptulose 7-phosphate isomerase [Oscillatoria laete-virens NRMC-F 0139]|nr:D-sedoheptulose 7-phosphate isomerase [Oscillatoria laete-virens]MDL5053657.1 D-sedoheptulose 7-phosphate isomerase [Oscillatoria laete-virens NRMC-F 0139]
MSHPFESHLDESLRVQSAMRELLPAVFAAAEKIISCLKAGGKILACGNGGSAADAQHLTEEFIGRYRSNRIPLPAIALTADTQAITCIANDFGYEEIFSRQVRGLGKPGDVLVTFSTSGNSENILRAIKDARALGMTTINCSGKDGGKAKGLADVEIIVPSQSTARIQEAHTFILHCILEHVEEQYA